MAKYRIRKETDHTGDVVYFIEKRVLGSWMFLDLTHSVTYALDLFCKYNDPKKFGLVLRGGKLLQSNEVIEKTENKIL